MVAGRPAELPVGKPEPRWEGSDGYVFIAASTGRRWIFDFAGTGLSAEMTGYFIAIFDELAGPLGTARSYRSAWNHFTSLRRLMRILGSAGRPVESPAQVPVSAFAEVLLQIGPRDYDKLRHLLRRRAHEFAPEVGELLHARPSRRMPEGTVEGYSSAEFARALEAARKQVRQARDRIRPNIRLLEQWSAGKCLDPQSTERARFLEQVAETADGPRYPDGRPQTEAARRAGYSSMLEAAAALFLSLDEALALGILLVGLTGQNMSTLETMTAPLHRTDVGEDSPGAAVISDALKPRRGKTRAAMTVTASNVAVGESGAGRESGDLRTAHGALTLLEELSSPARTLLGTGRLFCWASRARHRGKGPETRIRTTVLEQTKIRPVTWASRHGLLDDSGQPLQLDFHRLRLTHISHRDRPVAHTRRTMRRTYQARNTKELHRYQQIVAGVLETQVRQARSLHGYAFLSPEQSAAIQRDPIAGAAELELPVRVVERLATGQLDTVLAACVDNDHGPHNQGPCTASFLLCAGCPCAIALPEHWPLIATAHERIRHKRAEMTELDWANRFGQAEARLATLVDQMPAGAAKRAAAEATTGQRELIERLLDGELKA